MQGSRNTPRSGQKADFRAPLLLWPCTLIPPTARPPIAAHYRDVNAPAQKSLASMYKESNADFRPREMQQQQPGGRPLPRISHNQSPSLGQR